MRPMLDAGRVFAPCRRFTLFELHQPRARASELSLQPNSDAELHRRLLTSWMRRRPIRYNVSPARYKGLGEMDARIGRDDHERPRLRHHPAPDAGSEDAARRHRDVRPPHGQRVSCPLLDFTSAGGRPSSTRPASDNLTARARAFRASRPEPGSTPSRRTLRAAPTPPPPASYVHPRGPGRRRRLAPARQHHGRPAPRARPPRRPHAFSAPAADLEVFAHRGGEQPPQSRRRNGCGAGRGRDSCGGGGGGGGGGAGRLHR